MPRHPVLIPLSRDHHRDLVHARRLQAAAQETASERVAPARAFVAFFSTHMVSHFRREEETVFPLLVEGDSEDRALLVEALLDHQQLHALAARLADELETDAVSSEVLDATGSLLESHVRLEERRLFPLVEQLAGERLDQIDLPPQQDSPVVDLDAAEGEGPLWGAASDDLNITMLSWYPGSATPEHVNEDRDVLVLCLAGSGTVVLGGALHTFAEGQMLIIEKGSPRRIEAGPHGLRYLSVHLRRPGLQIASLVTTD
jgi:quercetin dioxygenase-like cupin family protein/hemerythrin-like domain-containing protein